jgi:uncharacterized damage-inducible protein DinB
MLSMSPVQSGEFPALLADAFGRVHEQVHAVVAGLSEEQLATRLDADANSIAWLCWHLARVQDDHLAGAFGAAQVWHEAQWATWAERFGLSPDNVGYGNSSKQVAQVRAPAEMLTGYLDAVHAQTVRLLGGLTEADLPRIVDERWDPPVTLSVRLVSVISDCLQHVGQAAFIRGVLLRR